VDSGLAWQWELPTDAVDKVSINFLEFLATVVGGIIIAEQRFWILLLPKYFQTTNKHNMVVIILNALCRTFSGVVVPWVATPLRGLRFKF
jgi:hypothetical protein